MHAVIASAGDESPGGDGTSNRDALRAPLETGEQEPWFDRIEAVANDPTTWRNRAIRGYGLRARTEPGETDPKIYCDRATGDDSPCGSTQERFRSTLAVAIWFLEIMADALHIALQHMQRRIRREEMVQ